MDHNNNWNLLSILENDRINENNEMRQDFAQNGYKDTEYNPSTTTSTFSYFSGSSSSITDSFHSTYVSTISKPPKILPIQQIFDLPIIVPFIPKQSPLDGFGSLSVGSVPFLPKSQVAKEPSMFEENKLPIHQTFAMPKIVPFKPKQSPLDGFGAVSLDSVSPLPPKSPDVFKIAANRKLSNSIKYCYVCAKNPKMFYESHTVRDSNRNISCPVLLNYICKTCGISGHTEKYCPSSQETRKNQLHEQWQNISFCTFCKSCAKTHPERIVYSHNTNDFDGNIQCLILKNYLCSKCGATGNDAHIDDDCFK